MCVLGLTPIGEKTCHFTADAAFGNTHTHTHSIEPARCTSPNGVNQERCRPKTRHASRLANIAIPHGHTDSGSTEAPGCLRTLRFTRGLTRIQAALSDGLPHRRWLYLLRNLELSGSGECAQGDCDHLRCIHLQQELQWKQLSSQSVFSAIM